MKWIMFFLVSFVGIFVGLLFVTGVAQKQLLPLVKSKLAHHAPAPSAEGPAAASAGAAAAAGSDSARLAQAGSTASASPGTAPAGAGSPAGAAAQAGAASAGSTGSDPRKATASSGTTSPGEIPASQRDAVTRAVPAPRTPEQQQRDALIAKIYGEMKPEDAARILKQLDDGTALAIVSHLKAEKAARLLEAFGPERSVRITLMWAGLGAGSTEGGATP